MLSENPDDRPSTEEVLPRVQDLSPLFEHDEAVQRKEKLMDGRVNKEETINGHQASEKEENNNLELLAIRANECYFPRLFLEHHHKLWGTTVPQKHLLMLRCTINILCSTIRPGQRIYSQRVIMITCMAQALLVKILQCCLFKWSTVRCEKVQVDAEGNKTYKADVYSLEIILLMLLHPKASGTKRKYSLDKLKRIEFPDAWENESYRPLKSLLSDMLSENPDDRPSTEEVLPRVQVIY
ncbi:hypothetical protein POTOM_045604 [Populus tomentosa]|uniref:Protein kinase domain-containing protein n=1 Tax=Populus tomentosa TaxID=118781 RepID=A0A8X8CEC6_POPTO|nr:hypothetical protein POTOM_045604 [Populus tomentosa]